MANRQRTDLKRQAEERLLVAARAWYADRSRRSYTANNQLLTDLFEACKWDAKVENLDDPARS
jgi:hypothetical protein